MAGNTAEAAEAVLDHHLGAFAHGVDEIMSDYTDESVIITQTQAFKGRAEIRAFFENFIKTAPEGFWGAFKISTKSAYGDVAYLVWSATPWVTQATDTLVIRDKKIMTQTFTAYSAAS